MGTDNNAPPFIKSLSTKLRSLSSLQKASSPQELNPLSDSKKPTKHANMKPKVKAHIILANIAQVKARIKALKQKRRNRAQTLMKEMKEVEQMKSKKKEAKRNKSK